MTHQLGDEFMAVGDGRSLLRGAAAGLVRWFDHRFHAMALDDGAVECRFPTTIARDTLTRAGYFEAAPEGATTLAGRASAYCLAPAVCYHVYEMLAGESLATPIRLTAAQSCFREADREAATAGRLWEFTMREAIFVGPGDWVWDERARWEARIDAFARDLDLAGARLPASDPFFTGVGRGRSLIQQLKGLKEELRLTAGSDTLAVASFNVHETFFGKRFGISLPDGTAAQSGCVAFGLERWALAVLTQHGPKAAEALLDS